MNVIRKNNVKIFGDGRETLIFAHGFGCDQKVWNEVAPHFAKDYQVILYDLVGSGGSDLTAYDRVKYGTLHGYADDLIEMCEVLDVVEPIIVGHSVSATIGALAAIKKPNLFKKLVMVAPSPCFLNEGDYPGGYERATINSLLDSLESNFVEWSKALVPLVLGNQESPLVAERLFQTFCSNRPEIAKHFAQVTFLSDFRNEMSHVPISTLVLQCSEDSLAPLGVGSFLKRTIPNAELIQMNAIGHCPHLSSSEETTREITKWLNSENTK